MVCEVNAIKAMLYYVNIIYTLSEHKYISFYYFNTIYIVLGYVNEIYGI